MWGISEPFITLDLMQTEAGGAYPTRGKGPYPKGLEVCATTAKSFKTPTKHCCKRTKDSPKKYQASCPKSANKPAANKP